MGCGFGGDAMTMAICEAQSATTVQVGWCILAFGLLIAYIWLLCYIAEVKNDHRIAAIGFLAPIVLSGLAMILWG
jgi:hypothetical protein